ncbi:MAG TPA: ABC transporter ATP-binding protein [Longimicrobium sp.]|nr:ABC transporter ATP-binding protein [Longimicrobium sp.]
MREHWRAIVLLLRATWRTDPKNALGGLAETLSYLRIPLFAWCLKLMTEGAIAQDPRPLAMGAAGIGLMGVMTFVGMWVGTTCMLRLTETVGFAFSRDIAEMAAAVPGLEHHERADYQDRLELLRGGHGALTNSLSALLYTFNLVLMGVGMLVALAVASPWLLLIIPFTLPAFPIARAEQRWFREAEDRMAEPGRRFAYFKALTADRNAGMEVRVFGLGPEVVRRMEESWLDTRRPPTDAGRRSALLSVAGSLFFLVGFGGMITVMLWLASRGRITAGDVVMAIFLAQQVRAAIVDPVRGVTGLGGMLRQAGRLLWLMDYTKEALAKATGTRPAPDALREGIVFDHVSFRYPGTDRWVLRDVSFRIPAGGVIALVGENGAGKTTIVKLLCRMYEPTEGRILVDGVDLAEIGVEEWRKRLSAAFQDFARFEFTAQHTVGVGHLPGLDDPAAVQAALDHAGAGDLPATLPAGTQTQLGTRWEGGVDLSTGQWQKVALGRALMRDAPLVLFFDEPTASLDALAEHALFERYTRAARAGSERGAVTVLVSHRFSTVRSAHLILVIDGGTVTELGSHEDLIVRGGLYAELYQLQARAYA